MFNFGIFLNKKLIDLIIDTQAMNINNKGGLNIYYKHFLNDKFR